MVFRKNSVSLINSYLSNRKQQVKIGSVTSDWDTIHKGVPQGSILGPLLFNVFINDIFLFVDKCTLYNYADDNTLSYIHHDFDTLVNVLERESGLLIDWFKVNRMQANPEKFQALAVGKRTFSKTPVFTIDSVLVPCEESVKLLGIEIDYQLNFDAHIKSICRKASQQLNVLKRIGRYLSKLNKLTIFHSFILSNFNFCPLAWYFCSKRNSQKLEKIQERSLRFIYNDKESTYEQLMMKAQVSSLEVKRMRNMAIETFNILYGLSPACLNDLVSFKESNYNFRYKNILNIPKVRTTAFGKNSVRYAAAILWNRLPEHIRSMSNFNQFKNVILMWNGKDCGCQMCKNDNAM